MPESVGDEGASTGITVSSRKSSKSAKTSRSASNESIEGIPSKSKIAERLEKHVENANMNKNKNRSPDLIPLTEEYELMKKKLRKLVTVVKTYNDSMEAADSARNDLVEHLAHMSAKSPIYDSVGGKLDKDAVEELKSIRKSSKMSRTVEEVGKAWKKRYETDVCSLKIVQDLNSSQTKVNAREYNEHVLGYVLEWEKVVTERVERELKKVRKLQGDRTHYERKVEGLRARANDLEAKGKPSPDTAVEKLERNEEKLRSAFLLHESDATRLCILIEAAAKDGWKDLYHFVKNYIKWESNRVGRESDIFCQLSDTLVSMKSEFKENSKKSATKGS